jgi:hypothetical protein
MRLKLTLIALAVIAVVGCGRGGPDLAEVEGTLTLRGTPFPNVTLCFVPDAEGGTLGPRSTGVTDENGHYKLVCEGMDKPGALIGRHAVLVYDPEALNEPPQSARAASLPDPPMAKNKSKKGMRYSPNYMVWAKTPLRVEVSGPGPQVIDLNVE